MSAEAFWLNRLLDYRNPRSFGSYLRRRRAVYLLPLLEAIHREQGHVRILDIGGSGPYWQCLPHGTIERLKIELTIANLPDSWNGSAEFPHYTYIEADGCALTEIADNSFDLAHSNSTIEHVIAPDRRAAFAREIARVAPRYYVQTPSRWLPIDPHVLFPFFHWLPLRWRVWLHERARVGRHPRALTREAALTLAEDAWLLGHREMKRFFPDAKIMRERFAGMTKSYLAIK